MVVADGSLAPEGYAFARRHGCRLLLYLWDLKPWQMDGGLPDHVFPVGSRLVRIPRLSARYPERRGYHSRQRWIARRADAVWCPSRDAHREVATRFDVAVEQVPFCYDSDRFHPGAGRSAFQDGPRPVLLSISRLVDYKNHIAVIRAAARMASRPTVHLIGRGPEATHLRAAAAQLGVELRLDEGWVTDDAMVAAYRAATVVVCPSRFEGFGLTPIEGVAMEVPVVASDIAPHREFVGGHARLVPLDDDDALVRAIEAAMAVTVDVNASRTDRRASPLPDLTIEACVGRFLPRLRELVENGGL